MNNSSSELIQVPEIYTALVISFDRATEIDPIVSELKEIGISAIKVRKPRGEPLICLDIAAIKYETFWELNDALTKMFSVVDDRLQQLKDIICKYYAETYIDIAFYQYGKYPALSIYGENMEKIRFLEANISIDPLDG